MKKCSKCEQEKTNLEFTKDKRKKEGIGTQCKECYNRHKQEWRDANRDKVNEQSRRYCRKRRKEKYDECQELQRRFRERHRAKLNEKRRNYYIKNAERIRERQNELSRKPDKRKKMAEYMREYRKTKSSIQDKAHRITEHAIKVGFLIRPTRCENCMKECKPDAHHDDYEKPLEVKWLCRLCHMQLHRTA